ncbi:unnamed protein product, partial [Scytosiphon promiscuus]
KVGDRVIATNGMEPVGGMAEYAVVHTKFAGKAPPNVEPVQAAALPNSPITAMDAVKVGRGVFASRSSSSWSVLHTVSEGQV